MQTPTTTKTLADYYLDAIERGSISTAQLREEHAHLSEALREEQDGLNRRHIVLAVAEARSVVTKAIMQTDAR